MLSERSVSNMRITDQYIWNIVFTLFFLALVVMGAIILETESYRDWERLTLIDYVLMTGASWRLIRLFVYDAVTKWLREQFLDVEVMAEGIVLRKPAKGPRRTVADLFACPWCFGVWATALVVFCYMMFPAFMYVAAFLAVSAAASYLQLLANLTGHRAEQLKIQNERGY